MVDEKSDETRFVGTFTDKIREMICGDGGSVVNLLPSDTANKLAEASKGVNISLLDRLQTYGTAALNGQTGKRVKIVCKRKVSVNKLAIDCRHGTSLIIRNSEWMVPTQPATEALLGRPTSEALGLNNAEVFRAAASNNNGEVYFKQLVSNADYEKGTIARLAHADLEVMQVELKHGAKPVVAKATRYSPQKAYS